MNRDLFGFTRSYWSGDRHASTIRALLGNDRTLDPIAIEGHFMGVPVPDRTSFAAVRAVPPSYGRIEHRVCAGDFLTLLRTAVARILATAPRPIAVAVSGGLDSAIVLALVTELEPDAKALVHYPVLPGYSEYDSAMATLNHARVSGHMMKVTADDLLDALPAAITAFETPLYNLHPVTKYLLARHAGEQSFASVISGDGIDQVFTRDVSADYLPLTSAAFDACGVALHTPFLDGDVIAHVLSLPPSPDKRALRDVAATLPGVRPTLVTERKVSQFAPPIPLAGIVAPARLDALARRLGRERIAGDRDDVRWTTLALLLDALEAWP